MNIMSNYRNISKHCNEIQKFDCCWFQDPSSFDALRMVTKILLHLVMNYFKKLNLVNLNIVLVLINF